MSTVPNLACLNLSHSVMPTSGTGGGPEGGGPAGRALYEKKDLMELIAEHLKTLQAESVPLERRINCGIEMLFNMVVDDDDPDISAFRFSFELNFKYNGDDIPRASSAADVAEDLTTTAAKIKDAFTDTPAWGFSIGPGLKNTIRDVVRVSSASLANYYTYTINTFGTNRFRSFSEHGIYQMYKDLYNKWTTNPDFQKEFTKDLTTRVLRAINMTGIEDTFNITTSTVPGPNRTGFEVTLGIKAVTDADALMFSKPFKAPDRGLFNLLKVLRGEDENRKALAAKARAAADMSE